MADEAEEGLRLAYEAREHSELSLYEADARRRAALEQLKAVTPRGRIERRSVTELAPTLARSHEQLRDGAGLLDPQKGAMHRSHPRRATLSMPPVRTGLAWLAT